MTFSLFVEISTKVEWIENTFFLTLTAILSFVQVYNIFLYRADSSAQNNPHFQSSLHNLVILNVLKLGISFSKITFMFLTQLSKILKFTICRVLKPFFFFSFFSKQMLSHRRSINRFPILSRANSVHFNPRNIELASLKIVKRLDWELVWSEISIT